MPPPANKSKPPSRTTTLPASLRAELVQLGQLPALGAGKGKLGRKEKRKAKRDDGKLNRAKHFEGKKRRALELEAKEEEEILAPAPPTKKIKLAPPPPPPPAAAPIKSTTPLERMLAKQEASQAGPVSATRKKSQVESTEDLEIAWLEAKLGVRGGGLTTAMEKGKWNEEIMDDGLDELFAGIDDLEEAAFGTSSKDYTRLQKDQDALEHSSDESDEELDSDEEENEFGVEEEELIDPSDDDDHAEMGEIGSSEEEGGMEMTFGGEDFADLGEEESDGGGMEMTFGAEDGESEEGGMEMTFGAEESEEEVVKPKKGKKSVTFDADLASDPIASTSTAPPTRYVPPHLRSTAASTPSVSPFAPEVAPVCPTEEVVEDPRLRRQIMGLLNKLSSSNIPSILAALTEMYTTHPRALVSTTLTSLLLEIISGRDNLGEQFVITYAALVSAVSCSVGIEFPAGVIAKCVAMFDLAHAQNIAARSTGTEEQGGFEGRPGSKACENLVAFLSELYNFGVVACLLVYDLVKLFIDRGLEELEVELLVKVVKRCGQQLRQDDPSALKEIIGLVKAKMTGLDPSTMNSRTRFMIEALTNLKNNKIKPTADGAIDNYSNLKKFLTSLRKRSAGGGPDALRLTLGDIRSSSSKGKWWIVGAAWGGDPLVDAKNARGTEKKESQSDEVLSRLAKKQGMNTDIRKSVFNVLMSSEDYVDACERLLQLGLTDVQQREIARILLQCSGNEKTYNPYYTLVAFRMSTKSRSFQITLQYCLWDFLRELGEKSVGGEEMVKGITDDGVAAKVSTRRIGNLAKLYAWCVAKEALSIAIFKPIPFLRPRPQTIVFLQHFFSALLLSTQCVSPALILAPTVTRKDKESIEKVFVKASPHDQLVKGLTYFLESAMEDGIESSRGEKERGLLKWGLRTAVWTLKAGGGMVDFSDLR